MADPRRNSARRASKATLASLALLPAVLASSTSGQPTEHQRQGAAQEHAQCIPEAGPLRTGAPARRNRIRIVDNTLVTDNGEILRAAHGNSRNLVFAELEWWTTLRDVYGLNTVRLDTRITRRPTNAPYPDSRLLLLDLDDVFANVDIAVDRADEAGMYVIVANFTSCCGESSLDLNEIFWEEAARRYSTRRHVIFEIQNEPVQGVSYDDDDVALQERMYHFVRQRAPDTHIILWSAMYGARRELIDIVGRAPSIHYGNASVGVHLYWHDRHDPEWRNVNRLRERYPVMNTEFSADDKTGKVDLKKVWDYSESTRLAWAFLDLRRTANGPGNYGDGVLHTCVWPFDWPIPAR